MIGLKHQSVILMNETTQISTLSLSTAQVAVFLRMNAMRVTGRLGSLALSDDSNAEVILPDFKQIMSIEGENFVDFRYETYDITDPSYDGIKSSVYLNVASLKIHYLEQPLHDIYLFMTKLARFKGLYDAATQAAVQSASEIDKMAIEVQVRSPIIIIPSGPSKSKDVLTLRLGEINAKNAFNQNETKTTASLRGIQFSSTMHYDQEVSHLKIVDDIDIATETVQNANIDREKDIDRPDTQVNFLMYRFFLYKLKIVQVAVQISDVKLHLTQTQYVLLIALSQSIPRVLAGASEGTDQVQSSISSQSPSTPDGIASESQSQVALNPELNPVPTIPGARIWSSLDVVVTISTVKLHLYDEQATTEASLKEHGIARFALNHNSLRYKMLSDGSGEAQVVLKSFTVNNTRQGNSKFREIIPAAQHDRNQFMILYTMSGGKDSSSMAVLTIDSPQVIFAVEPVIALLTFFSSAFNTPASAEEPQENVDDSLPAEKTPKADGTGSRIDFRVDLHDVFISVLENDADVNSQAIRLTINQIQLSQQVRGYHLVTRKLPF
jgi:vacuolar protein sorting-associated protein 13A/C